MGFQRGRRRAAPVIGTRARTWLRSAPWILILAAISAVQVVRDQPFDAAIFGVGTLVLVLDAMGALPAGRRRPSIRLAVLIAAAAALVTVLALAPRHGVVTGIAVGAIGVGAVSLAWFLPPPREADDDPAARRTRVRRAAIGWACVALVMCLVELWSFLTGRLTAEAKGEHPAISELLDPVLDDPFGRLAFAVAWLALGVLLVTRGRRGRDA